MVVDDEPDVAFALKATLEENELFQVDTFYDAESALAKFRPENYDLAVLDIRMPKMNCFQLFRRLRKIDNNLKICFLTATELLYYRETDSDVIEELGTDCFISKPINNEDIINKLESIISVKTMSNDSV